MLATNGSTPTNHVVSGKAPATTDSMTGAEIETKSEQVIIQAKDRTTVMQKLKQCLTSKDGKSRADGKEPVQPTTEALQITKEETEEASDIPPLISNPKLKAALDAIPGANTLSQRIQVLLSSTPPFLQTVPEASQTPVPDETFASKQGPASRPDPAPVPAPPSGLSDPKLLEYLSDASVMNNDTRQASKAKGKTRKSVWQVLDQLVPYKPPVVTVKDGEESTEEEAAESSLMVSGPLVPTENSVVHIADSEVIEVEALEDVPGVPKNVVKGVFLSLFPDKLKIPFSKKKTVSNSPSSDTDTKPPTPTPALTPTTHVKVWIPSQIEMSFQVAWWGFRLWLPPPVMLVLSDKTLEATKRAAMVTTAIGWLIRNIPLALLPAPLKPAILLLKAVVPYLGGFIAWSWSEVKKFDKGHGVTLSATWLLPIALIPGPWEVAQENATRPTQAASGNTALAPTTGVTPTAGNLHRPSL
ncbi:hypothetical protein FRB98_006596 [Tulasnella sp. 332]|nr:hypothetical protein FRB98_006596 [Tulasnella sp. 332]